MILSERITLHGNIVKSPTFEVQAPERGDQVAIKVDGRLVHDIGSTLQLLQTEQKSTTSTTDGDKQLTRQSATTKEFINAKTRVWLCNKLKGELITEDDPDGRPSMLQRLIRGGVGADKKNNNFPIHLKPVGRLDMMTEGLIIVTNDGQYARSLELPANQLWRTYRVRVHGRLTIGKLNAMRKGVTVKLDDDVQDKTASGEVVKGSARTMKYKGIKVSIERNSITNRRKRGGLGQAYSGGTNAWLQITCTEGKNRMLRRILNSMGLDVTRLIRISYGDYDLNTIPPGKALEVPCKSLEKMKKKGSVFVSERADSRKDKLHNAIANQSGNDDKQINTVQWINYS
jgi:23S rRNA pseudouridine2605 synthase